MNISYKNKVFLPFFLQIFKDRHWAFTACVYTYGYELAKYYFAIVHARVVHGKKHKGNTDKQMQKGW